MSARPPLTTQAIESGIRDLPPLPAVVAEIIASTRNEQLDVQDLATKISHDVALSARTLKLANSPFYGVTRQVDSISDAAVILGMRTIRSVAVGAGLVTRLRTGQCVGFDYTIFWRHSIAAALVAQSMASAAQCDGDTAFLLGLLHDLGRVGLATAFGEDYAEALRVQRQRDCLLIEAERATLGVDHMQVGGLIAEVLNAIAQSQDGQAPLVEAAIKERVKALTDRFPIY